MTVREETNGFLVFEEPSLCQRKPLQVYLWHETTAAAVLDTRTRCVRNSARLVSPVDSEADKPHRSQALERLTMANIENLKAFDAFDDAGEDAGDQSKIHIRVQQRNGRKCITTIQGLADDLDVKRICKAFKKNFSCNGAVSKDEEMGEVIQLSGDQRTLVKDFLVDQEICHNNQIVIHGF
mmetsp:Transcript_72213/g.205278  ORF Transcript_72213/g.205278 Transcript_72213/m.205278 type:complete len:181 (-) Transcript_72213:1441-1983(-)